MRSLVWFRENLRLADNYSLTYAAEKGEIVAAFVIPKGIGEASKWWLYHSLKSLREDLNKQQVSLILVDGEVEVSLLQICRDLKIDQLVWDRVYSPSGMEQGAKLKKLLDQHKIQHKSFQGQLLIEPTQVLNKQGTAFKVFTPFWRHCSSLINPQEPLPVPTLKGVQCPPMGESLDALGLLPSNPDWSGGIAAHWHPGESFAHQKLEEFLHRYSAASLPCR